MTDKPPPFTPKQFGRYLLVERLAVGGMAEIFKAKTKGAHGFEKTLVIKRILPHLAVDREFTDMFIDEAKLMVRLNHPKIVQVLDFGEIDRQYYMALEYIDGIDGLALLRRCASRRARPTTGIALHVAADVLDALAYAHELRDERGEKLGVIHRDISPSNIFISWLGEVKLGDFGIARAAVRRGHTEGGALKGKYGYMAPEQVSDRPVDCRADIFAVGVVLTELLMIRRLFYAKNDLEVLLQVRDARLDRLDRYGARIPADLRAILDSALARDPNMRYQTAAAFRDALHRYLFDHRRMVRADDVRNFLERLTEGDDPVADARPDSLEVPVLDSVGLDSVGLDSVGLDSVGLDSVGLDSVGLDSDGLDSVGLDAGGLHSGLDSDGLDEHELATQRTPTRLTGRSSLRPEARTSSELPAIGDVPTGQPVTATSSTVPSKPLEIDDDEPMVIEARRRKATRPPVVQPPTGEAP
ncbi:MAG: serine/threonine protein kinase, partial [Myxococcales bacterium]|nr:serine/threonine protein kinase [Myxococcales bacterium]